MTTTQEQQTLQAAGRQPRGWDKMVDQLVGAEDPQAFFKAMLDLQCKVVAADYGAMWTMNGEGEVQALTAWPEHFSKYPADHPVIKMLAQAAAGGYQRGASHVLKVETDDLGGSQQQAGVGAHVFVTPIRNNGKIEAVSTAVADCRDPQVIQTTAPLREMAAGLYNAFEARKSAEMFRQEAEQVRKAMSLLAISQEAEGFKGAGMNLVNELARQLKCNRVTLGWVKGKSVKLVAMSDTENLKNYADDVAKLELAMSECLDQQQPIVYPIPEKVEQLLAHAVVHAHRGVTDDHPNRHVVSVPLRVDEEWVGVLTLERTDGEFEPALIQQLQLIADVIAPHLHDRQITSRWLPVHAWHSFTWAGGFLLGPKHVGWKVLSLLVLALLLFVLFGYWPYKVSAPFTISAEDKRIIPAPFEGEIAEVLVDAGDWVDANQPLLRLDVTEKLLERTDSAAKLRSARLEYNRAIADAVTDPAKRADAQKAKAEIEQIEARIELLDYEINRATIRSPIEGQVLVGSWHDKVGGVVDQGEALFEVAKLDQLIAVVKVDESDIDEVRATLARVAAEEGKRLGGTLATRSNPEISYDFLVERIVPLAGPDSGNNVFEVRAKISLSDEQIKDGDLLPGMEGMAKVKIGPRPIRWIATHKVIDTIRLWTWWQW